MKWILLVLDAVALAGAVVILVLTVRADLASPPTDAAAIAADVAPALKFPEDRLREELLLVFRDVAWRIAVVHAVPLGLLSALLAFRLVVDWRTPRSVTQDSWAAWPAKWSAIKWDAVLLTAALVGLYLTVGLDIGASPTRASNLAEIIAPRLELSVAPLRAELTHAFFNLAESRMAAEGGPLCLLTLLLSVRLLLDRRINKRGQPPLPKAL